MMTLGQIIALCVGAGAMAGAIAGAFPDRRFPSAIAFGMLCAGIGLAFVERWLGPKAAAHGFMIGGFLGAIYGVWSPYRGGGADEIGRASCRERV